MYLAAGLIFYGVGKQVMEKKLEAWFESEGSGAKSLVELMTTSTELGLLLTCVVTTGLAASQRSQQRNA